MSGFSYQRTGPDSLAVDLEASALARLKALESDPRLRDYESANVFANAVLALIQTDMRGECNGLRRALGLPLQKYPLPKEVNGGSKE